MVSAVKGGLSETLVKSSAAHRTYLEGIKRIVQGPHTPHTEKPDRGRSNHEYTRTKLSLRRLQYS